MPPGAKASCFLFSFREFTEEYRMNALYMYIDIKQGKVNTMRIFYNTIILFYLSKSVFC